MPQVKRRLGSDAGPRCIKLMNGPEWRNWQTHETQNLAPVTRRVGSIPSSGTIPLACNPPSASRRLAHGGPGHVECHDSDRSNKGRFSATNRQARHSPRLSCSATTEILEAQRLPLATWCRLCNEGQFDRLGSSTTDCGGVTKSREVPCQVCTRVAWARSAC